MNSYTSEKGQMLLLVILVMVVALTVGLSVASRSITSVRISKQNEESQRALQVAQAGIDLALKQSLSGTAKTFNGKFTSANEQYTTIIQQANSNIFKLNNGEILNQDQGYDVWLAPYGTPNSVFTDNTKTLAIYWAADPKPTNCTTTGGSDVVPALEVIWLSNSLTTPTITKRLIEGCAFGTRVAAGTVGGDSFTVAENTWGTDIPDMTFYRKLGGIAPTNAILMRIIPLFNSTRVAIKASVNLPSQGKIVESEGAAGPNAGTVRRLTYFESLPQTPAEVFQYALMSQD